jgi:2-oxoglutarate ferredoxin oxidoreductase subunit delta
MTIRLHLPFPRHTKTAYIELDTKKCQACWKCLEVCSEHVFGKVSVFRHRHARIDDADACKGCKKCVLDCPSGAIRYTYIPPNRKPRAESLQA